MNRTLAAILAVAALSECASETAYTMPASMLEKVTGGRVDDFFMVPANNVIEPAPYEGWFVSSRFIRQLGSAFEKAGAFGWLSPEYCSLIWINVNPARMVHASKLVSYDLWSGKDGTYKCPPIAGIDATAGQGHSHREPTGISLGDSLLANIARHKNGRHTYVESVVMFSNADSLSGINPETHQTERVPQQDFLFIKVRGEVRAYMWVPLKPTLGLTSLVQVYVPDGADGWRKATRCWVKDADHQAWLPKSGHSMIDAKCDDEIIWQ